MDRALPTHVLHGDSFLVPQALRRLRDETGANEAFRLSNTFYDNINNVPASDGGFLRVGDWFGATPLDSGSTGDGDVFLADQIVCNDPLCRQGACPVTQLFTFPTEAFIPTAVVGQKITAVRLGTHYKQIGAR